ncbi:deoxyribodipyrimidine photo-lyase [Roseomonas sp. CECT 9278]|uniref:cryptochrome/photolyase family protein n=1 Tax=Roseomonas sp. CECT 9278 TaxID=2845823 RepID=UPI001E4BDCA4|nr:deoxyribodipyrimidine photo-lyase [Roseomonas sp. CECT 9278]CAH0244745.1 Deoxyribodipyrimidine photo-lyase [Roseomonas sp. CECT 9278]
MSDTAILWFRQDLRLTDHPALDAVAQRRILPVYILEDGPWAPGGAARWWLHHSLAALGQDLAQLGAPLVVLRGDPRRLIPDLATRVAATEVHAGRRTEPAGRRCDAETHAALEVIGARLVLHRTALLHEPHQVRTGAGAPYGVYTPFSRNVFASLEGLPPPLPTPGRLVAVPGAPVGLGLDALDLLPQPPVPDWAAGFGDHWQPGEAGAAARLAAFLDHGLAAYGDRRNDPGAPWGTSGLSPHLHLGEVSPRQVWHAAKAKGGKGLETFQKEMLWREFSHHLLWHRPEMPEAPLRADFAAFPWRPDASVLRAWQRGRTGYPIVDAGMRQLWQTGWMHNRVRMITASFLVKHLLQPWQDGEAWFWDTLVDADLAANAASWQWVAGCGADAAPYFRIFNPVLQGEKFDPSGRYVRRWCPELAALPDRWIHRVHEAPDVVLRGAGITLGRQYPAPLVDLAAGRARALAAFAAIKGDAAA